MKARHGDRRYRASIWRRLLGWILPERRDGWEQRARPVIAGSDEQKDRRHSQVPFYGVVVNRRKECGDLEHVSTVPAVPGAVRASAAEAAPVERERQLDSGME